MIQREKYLKELIKSENNGFPKVITGIRRCGKSYLLKEIYKNYLINKGVKNDHIIILDLDDDINYMLRNPLELSKYIRNLIIDKETYYVFLDEIQRVYSIVNPGLTDGKIILAKESDTEIISFVDIILGLSHESNIDLYVTGSNSKMLSSDIITEFRDKATNIHIGPLSFKEFSDNFAGSKSELLYKYMQYGGMPLAVLMDENDKRKYLTNLFNLTYFKDIMEHNNLNKSETLDEICNILSDYTGTLLNSEKIANTFKSVKKENISKQTIEKYLNYFEDSFLIREAKRYDLKGKKAIGAQRKYYFVDTGLRNARVNFRYSDDGQLLENVIYNELLFHDYNVNIGTFNTVEKNNELKSIRKTYEIDFYATKGNNMYYIQVTDNIVKAETKIRELRPFLLLNDQIRKIIVINKPISETRDEYGFTVIGATDFLLNFLK